MIHFCSRLLLLLLASTLGVLTGWLDERAGWLSMAFSFVVALAAYRDRIGLPPRDCLEMERRVDSRGTVGRLTVVRICLRNRSSRTLRVTVLDQPDVQFGLAEEPEFLLDLAPFSESEIAYEVCPTRRGLHRFADLQVRIQSRWGLLACQWDHICPQEIKVYPKIVTLDGGGLRGPISGRGSGAIRTRVPGQGTDFAHLRDYQENDDPRTLDWKATARLQRPVSRTYQAERNQTVILMLDAGRLSNALASHRPKLEWCLEAAGALAQLALRSGDQVGLLAYADRVLRWVPPRSGMSHFQVLLEALHDLSPLRLESQPEAAVSHLLQRHRKRALVPIFTDVADPSGAQRLVNSLAPLRAHHLPLIATIQDQQLLETARSCPSNQRELYRVGVCHEMLLERHQALAELRRQGALTIDRPAQDLGGAALQNYLDIKLRNRL